MHRYEHLKDIPLFSTIIVILFGFWGAILNFAKREQEVRNYSVFRKFNLFILDLLTSGGTAIIVFYGLVGWGFTEPFSVAIAGIAAHQGTNLIYYIELYIASKYGTKEVVEEIKKEM
jgi:uncharacterized membrane protein